MGFLAVLIKTISLCFVIHSCASSCGMSYPEKRCFLFNVFQGKTVVLKTIETIGTIFNFLTLKICLKIGQKIIVPIVSIVFKTTASQKHKFFVFTNIKTRLPCTRQRRRVLKCYNVNVSVTFCHAYCFITFLALSLLTLTR